VPRAGRRGRFVVPLLAMLIGSLTIAVPAQATFHLVKIREIFTGGAGGGSYIELQMWTSGQNFVRNHPIVVYNPNGSVKHSFAIPGDVANGNSQATVLIAGPGYGGPAADATDGALDLPSAGGAVCFTEGQPPDCVSWGSFPGAASLPSATGTPASAGGVTSGRALHRSISAGCATLLEPDDDTDNSAADFSEQSPNPRPNASRIDETDCSAPNTSIVSATVPNGGKTNGTDISFTFSATPSAGATFECKLDDAAFSPCTSPQDYSSLDGNDAITGTAHTFQVRAKNVNGTDSSPATHSWTVDTVAPTMRIVSQPADPSAGASASLTYQANETVRNTQCKLDAPGGAGAFASCVAGSRTYTGLVDGAHTFSVRATDSAGNQSAPAAFPNGTYSWTVDNSLTDTDPPETRILSRPADPSGSSTASFTYASDEPGSTFRCKLDGGPFAPCDAGGIQYTGLSNGAHAFQVQATDSSGNTDVSPAGYSWSVAVPDPAQPPPMPSPPPNTKITGKPTPITRDRTPTFKFQATINPATFECKLDGAAFRACRSPFTTRLLSFGRHTVQIRAVAGGVADPSPAKFSFRVAKRRRVGRR
jgi:hypothetical protein